MLELLAYLKDNHFSSYIVSGGDLEFMRAWAPRVYGIPPERIIGSRLKTQAVQRDGKPALLRLPEFEFFNNASAKPISIRKVIGRRPIAAFGNSDGDLQMRSGPPPVAASGWESSSVTPTPSASGPTTGGHGSATSTRHSARPPRTSGPWST